MPSNEIPKPEDPIRSTEALLQFIRKSPTAFHAVEQISVMLEENGFTRLEEAGEWNLRSGKGYYVTRNLSSVIAFRIPSKTPEQALISASHSDSPMFKLKTNPETESCGVYLKLNTEMYGGTILSSWLDRPLSLGGRVILAKDGIFTAQTVCIDRDLLLIPNVAIHMNREINNGYKLNPAVDLMPLFGEKENKMPLRELIAAELRCNPDEIVGQDLYVYNRMPGSVWGADNEFFSAPRIDNLMCAWGTLTGFCRAKDSADSLNLCYCADNEETGSATKQGAGSAFLSDVLDRICAALGCNRQRLLASSFMVSADNGHAQHPNHPEWSDAANAPKLNGGVVIKSNAAQLYTTDGLSSAVFAEVCKAAKVPVQSFANRSDLRGGSTLGSISNTKVPLNTVDVGMAQLAMHSAYETAGSRDPGYLVAAMRQFYEMTYRSDRDGKIQLQF